MTVACGNPSAARRCAPTPNDIASLHGLSGTQEPCGVSSSVVAAVRSRREPMPALAEKLAAVSEVAEELRRAEKTRDQAREQFG